MFKRRDIERSFGRIVEIKYYRSQNIVFSLVTNPPLYLSIIRGDDCVGIPQLERRFK